MSLGIFHGLVLHLLLWPLQLYRIIFVIFTQLNEEPLKGSENIPWVDVQVARLTLGALFCAPQLEF